MTADRGRPDSSATVVVIGGGPAGLMAAERLAGAGVRVRLFERMPTVGRKFLMAGRGGLNLTHSEPPDAFLVRYGTAAGWLRPALEGMPPAALVAWAEGLGQPTFVGTSGRIFPRAMKASPLLRAWLGRLSDLGVEIETLSPWIGFEPTGRPLIARRGSTPTPVAADAVILALGGASWPRLGADGQWVAPMRAAGVAVSDLAPSNMGLKIAWSPFAAPRFGQPLKRIRVTLERDGVDVATLRGEAVMTETGLEGGAIYQVAASARNALGEGALVHLRLDLRPDVETAELARRLDSAPKGHSAASRLAKAAGLTPAAAAVLREGCHPLPQTASELAALIKAVRLEVTGVEGLARAISSAGGVRGEAVDGHFMLTALPGVFVAGEMLDWEAPTGGYLLQATFATAVRAAEGAASWLERGNSRDTRSRSVV